MAVACTKDRGYTTLTGMDPARIMKSYPMPSSKCCNVVTISSTIPLALKHSRVFVMDTRFFGVRQITAHQRKATGVNPPP